MAHRCKIQCKIPLDHRLPPVVRLPHQVQSLLREANHPLAHHPVQHKLLLAILVIHQQINLLLKEAVVVNLEQAKLKQQVITLAKQDLV
jgi:hypothetical protein